MKAIELMNALFALAEPADFSNTCDTCKAGDPNAQVSKVAVAMFATPEVVRQASSWGAQLLIVHEPTYYDHMDVHKDERIENEKRKLIEESGLTLYRYHDYPHYTCPDIIARGMVRQMALPAEAEHAGVSFVRLHLEQPMTPVQLAKHIEARCGIRHIRICGARDALCTEVSGMFGTPAGVFEELQREDSQIVMTGEACEWKLAEYARDAAQLGCKKALLILGHIGSERDGMVYAAKLIEKMHPELEVRYFECGEVYTYTDSEE